MCVCSFGRLSRSQTLLRKQLFKNNQNRVICFSGSPFLELGNNGVVTEFF